MMNFLHRSSAILLLTLALCAASLSTPVTVQAAQQDDARGLAGAWPATWDNESNEFQRSLPGALILTDGRLKFLSKSGIEWEIALADIKRLTLSERYGKKQNAIVIESLTGDLEYVAIMDGEVFMKSPKKILKVIDQALALPVYTRSSSRK